MILIAPLTLIKEISSRISLWSTSMELLKSSIKVDVFLLIEVDNILSFLMGISKNFYLDKYIMAANTKTAMPWNSTLILINLLLCFLLKFPFFAIAITPMTTINKAKIIDITKITGNILEVNINNSYQIPEKCLIIKYLWKKLFFFCTVMALMEMI